MSICGLFSTIVILLVLWLLSFLLHEFCHVIEGLRQGASEGYIYLAYYKFFPSLRADVSKVENKFLFYLSGGLYSGLILLPLAYVAVTLKYTPFDYAFTLACSANLSYSIFEALYGDKLEYRKYMIIHYLIYIAVFVVVTLMFLPSISSFLSS